MPELVKKSVHEILFDYSDRNIIWIGNENNIVEIQRDQLLCLMRKAQAEIHKRYQWKNDNWTLDELMNEITNTKDIKYPINGGELDGIQW